MYSGVNIAVTYLDDGHDVVCRLAKFGHIDIEMVQTIVLGLGHDNPGALANGMNTSQIGGRIEGRVWRTRNWDFRD